MDGASAHSGLAGSGLLAFFVVMLLKEGGVPVPVPSDLIMIGAGVQAASGSFSLLELLIALEVSILVGNSGYFLIVRGAGRRLIYRFGRFVGLTPARLDQAAAMLERRGALAVFIALNLPGVRAVIVTAAALAGMRYGAFLPPAIAGSTIFYGWHIALGYALGPAATALLERANVPLGPLLLGLAVLGLVGWLVLRRRRLSGAVPEGGAPSRLRSWSEAACPACLALAALQPPESAAADS